MSIFFPRDQILYKPFDIPLHQMSSKLEIITLLYDFLYKKNARCFDRQIANCVYRLYAIQIIMLNEGKIEFALLSK
jgi:hypothetical protein